jgi:hypothetical protein
VGNPPPPVPAVAADAEPPQPVYLPAIHPGRIWQGEIFRNLAQYKVNGAPGGAELEVDVVSHPLTMAVSQDCDIEKDYRRRQRNEEGLLPNVLFCVLHVWDEYEQVLQGEEQLGGKERKFIRQNQNERFQYLRSVAAELDVQNQGLPALVMDFRLYFTLPTEEVYEQLDQANLRACRLNPPYVEHVVQRFFGFQGRVALPIPHHEA